MNSPPPATREPPRFLARLRERKLFQWALAYLAGAWLALQVMDLLGDRFGWPEATFRIALALLGVGFLAALVAAWFHGEKGEQRVSGIELAMFAVLCVLAGAAVGLVGNRGSPAADEAALASEGPSLAVLPFVNLSGDPAQEYFSDGLTEELLNALVHVPGLKVAARTSSFAFKGENIGIAQIASQLGVRTVLEGSVRRSRDQLRVTAQLINAADGFHLWSETYDRRLEDVFAVQEEISRAIVGALEVQLGTSATGVPAVRRVSRLAHDAYLLGLFEVNKRTAESLHRAVAHFADAVAEDSTYAAAWAGKAMAYVLLPGYDFAAGAAELERGMEAARQAIAVDPAASEAHAALGVAYRGDWDWDASESAFRRALELNPNDGFAQNFYGNLLVALGRSEEGLAHLRRSVEIDPLSLGFNQGLINGLYYSRRFDEAVEQSLRVLGLEPDREPILLRLGRTYLAMGRYDEAGRTLRRWAEVSGSVDSGDMETIVRGITDPGRRSAARVALARQGELRVDGGLLGVQVCLLLGNREGALAIIERRYRSRDPNIHYIAVDPAFDSLHDEPRFEAVLEGMGLR